MIGALSACAIFVVLLLAAAVPPSNPHPTRYEKMLHATGRILNSLHYSPKRVDDKLSAQIFTRFIEELDPDKDILLKEDLKSLEKYRNRIDDEINGDSISFFKEAMQLFVKRAAQLNEKLAAISEKPFDFEKDESIIVDNKDKRFATNESEQMEKWRLRVKFIALQKYNELLDRQATDTANAKGPAELEKAARQHAEKIVKRYFGRLLNAKATDRYFSNFINTITNYFDPHTSFFMPVEKRAWDEDLSGKFYGIGAVIGENNGQVIISTVTPGGAAWKTGEVNNGDAILKIGEEAGEMVDIAGYEIPDAVKLIRGNKGTTVRMMLKKADGAVKTVSIARQELKLEETFAKSCILKKDGKNFGYIFLPKFYTDFDGDDGASCSRDVAREIIKLKKDNIDGLIIDLRDNGGGSLHEAVQLAGLFIPKGPVVQVKGREDAPRILDDKDGNVLYSGPLEVMVNEFSASASEIFAAAIQDYRRGIVTGSSSTYGKGTVQRPIPVNAAYNNSGEELGTIHLTIQKYYRINGNTTQLKGVTPDIILPGYYEYTNMLEKDNPTALPFDNLSKSAYSPWSVNSMSITEAADQYAKSRTSVSVFEQIRSNTKWLAEETKKPVSLQLEKYRARLKNIREKSTATRNLLRLTDSLVADNNSIDARIIAGTREMQDRNARFMNDTRRDRYISEALNIIAILSSREKVELAAGKNAN